MRSDRGDLFVGNCLFAEARQLQSQEAMILLCARSAHKAYLLNAAHPGNRISTADARCATAISATSIECGGQFTRLVRAGSLKALITQMLLLRHVIRDVGAMHRMNRRLSFVACIAKHVVGASRLDSMAFDENKSGVCSPE